MCRRIYEQMERFPIDIIGNYGIQTAIYNYVSKDNEIVADKKCLLTRTRWKSK